MEESGGISRGQLTSGSSKHLHNCQLLQIALPIGSPAPKYILIPKQSIERVTITNYIWAGRKQE